MNFELIITLALAIVILLVIAGTIYLAKRLTPNKKKTTKPSANRILTDKQIDEICASVKKGVTQSDLAKEYDVSTTTISRVCKANNVKPSNPRRNKRLSAKDKCEIVKNYKGEIGEQTALAKQYGVSRTTICEILKDRLTEIKKDVYSPRNKSGCSVARPRKMSFELAQQIRKEYQGKYGEQKMMADKYNINRSTIKEILSNRMWPTDDKGNYIARHNKLDEDKVRAIRKSYNGEIGDRQRLAKKYDVSISTIRQVITYETWRHVE